MAYNYALINKKTLAFLRERTQVSFDYLERSNGKSRDILMSWEDESNPTLPTIAQAKMLAKSLRVPFAGLYMPPDIIPIPDLPKLRNMRRTQGPMPWDDSLLNLSTIDLLNARQMLIETNEAIGIESVRTSLPTVSGNSSRVWAELIRDYFEIDMKTQYRSASSRQFYLYLRRQIESKGLFVQCYTGVPVEVARGSAIYYDSFPIIGLNENDRPPAKSFSLIHELVHIMQRNSSVCNVMYSEFSTDAEEVFCNAVAGEVLVPESALRIVLKGYASVELSLDIIERISKRFSVSKEVIIRRMYDISPRYISKIEYEAYAEEIRIKLVREKEEEKAARLAGQAPRMFSSPSRDAVDRNSSALNHSFLIGYGDGKFSKQDISRYVGIKEQHVEKYLREVSSWIK